MTEQRRKITKPPVPEPPSKQDAELLLELKRERLRNGAHGISLIPSSVIRKRDELFFPSWIACALTGLAMIYMGEQFKNETVSLGAISLEFCVTKERALKMFGSLSTDDLNWVIVSTLFDYVFMVAYTMAFVTATLKRGKGNRSSVKISNCMVLAFVMDAVENVGIIHMAENPSDIHWLVPPFVSTVAAIKFAMVFLSTAYIIKPFEIGKEVTALKEVPGLKGL